MKTFQYASRRSPQESRNAYQKECTIYGQPFDKKSSKRPCKYRNNQNWLLQAEALWACVLNTIGVRQTVICYVEFDLAYNEVLLTVWLLWWCSVQLYSEISECSEVLFMI